LLALNREKSHDTRVSVEAAADLVQLLQTAPAMAREAAGVLRSLASNVKNRAALLQAGAVDGLIRVLAAAGSRCTGDGTAVEVEPIKPTLTPPEIKRLKLDGDELVSSFAFKFNLRRYVTAQLLLRQLAQWQGGAG